MTETKPPAKGWTPERRAAQAARIRATRPWLKATGPRTKAGKKRASCNALKHGNRRAAYIEMKKAVKLNRAFRRSAIEALLHFELEDAAVRAGARKIGLEKNRSSNEIKESYCGIKE
jgi:hypothetical protein